MQANDLLRARDDLSEEHRRVLLLVSVEDLSYAEVANVLGIPIGSVMSRLSRARERLRQMTEGDARPALRRVN
jgi:RNA polymerase sigma-70 factor (ECF subfamily)